MQAWISDWQLKINVEKCNILRLGHNNLDFEYRIGGSLISNDAVCKDLGVYVSSDLSFSYHCAKIARNAHFRRRQFTQAFACRDLAFQVFLFCTYIRPIVESNSVVWSPHKLADINKIEDVQRKFSKFLPGLFNISYLERLVILGIDSLEARRVKADLVFLYKMVYGLVRLDVGNFFTFNAMSTRGHSLKINMQYSRLNYRKYFFINRVVPIWNSLSEDVVSVDSVDKLKKMLTCIDVSNYCRGRAYTAS